MLLWRFLLYSIYSLEDSWPWKVVVLFCTSVSSFKFDLSLSLASLEADLGIYLSLLTSYLIDLSYLSYFCIYLKSFSSLYTHPSISLNSHPLLNLFIHNDEVVQENNSFLNSFLRLDNLNPESILLLEEFRLKNNFLRLLEFLKHS